MKPKLARLPPLPSIRDILRLYQLRALRRLSQNFLLDLRITDKIVRAAGKIEGSHVCEIGPGPGSITRSILNKSPAKLIVLEKDRRFLPTLEMLKDSSPCEMDILVGDVLSFNMENLFPSDLIKLWSNRPPKIHLIGNLPFNVATPLIIKWLSSIADRSSAWKFGRVQMTLTFQKEVAERMVAPILSKQRCRLSVMVQNWCQVDHKYNIPGRAFLPKPEVDVGVVHFLPLVNPVIDLPFSLVEKVVRCLFSHRQKYCEKSLGYLFPEKTREDATKQLLTMAEINPTNRALQFTLTEIGRLCHAYKEIIADHPQLYKYNYRKPESTQHMEDQAIENSVNI
ncbi:mitochondrial transcription factor B1 [Rhodnius prolixus]|uniref:rRNA adenine N(6)-methyltransferase n=1 Tax=Rhodnius prolixus TaxID=13249 RepID=A0A4P6DFP8_RHOPR